MLDEFFDFVKIHFGFGDRIQQTQLGGLAGRNLSDLYILRLTEKIPLKPGKSNAPRRQVTYPGFHLVRQHSASLAGVTLNQGLLLWLSNSGYVDFDEIRIRN